MSLPRRPWPTPLLIVTVLTVLAGCQTTVPLEEHLALQEQTDALTEELDATEEELAERESRIAALEREVETLGVARERERSEAAALEDDLDLALEQLGALREDRLDLREELAELADEIERLRGAAIAVQRAEEAATEAERASSARAPQDAMSDALAGGGGFTRVARVGFQNDPRTAARLAGAAPGVAVDTAQGVPVLYDGRLDYEQTLVYLSIVDPEGRRPRLQLTAQYATRVEPIYLRTAIITIEGSDPVDPIDPIVLSGEPVRETDGTILREAFVMNADRTLIDRLATIVSSSRFLVTFVGMNSQAGHRPSVTERAAMSNMLFAFIDLGGVR